MKHNILYVNNLNSQKNLLMYSFAKSAVSNFISYFILFSLLKLLCDLFCSSNMPVIPPPQGICTDCSLYLGFSSRHMANFPISFKSELQVLLPQIPSHPALSSHHPTLKNIRLVLFSGEKNRKVYFDLSWLPFLFVDWRILNTDIGHCTYSLYWRYDSV